MPTLTRTPRLVAVACLSATLLLVAALAGTHSPVGAATTEFVTNPSVETALAPWSSAYNPSSRVQRTTGGYDGTYAVRATNNQTSSRDVGFRDNPSQVSSTVAGQAYSLSVWVRSEVAGRTINLKAREVTSSGGSPGALTQPYPAPDTAWHRIALTYVARGTGNDLSFVVYATAVGPNQGFWADLFSASVTTPDPSPTGTTQPTATATASPTVTTSPTRHHFTDRHRHRDEHGDDDHHPRARCSPEHRRAEPRRHAGRLAGPHAEDPPVDGPGRHELRQRLRLDTELLSVAGQLDERPLRPQQRPARSADRRLRPDPDDAAVPPAGGLLHRPLRQVPALAARREPRAVLRPVDVLQGRLHRRRDELRRKRPQVLRLLDDPHLRPGDQLPQRLRVEERRNALVPLAGPGGATLPVGRRVEVRQRVGARPRPGSVVPRERPQRQAAVGAQQVHVRLDEPGHSHADDTHACTPSTTRSTA